MKPRLQYLIFFSILVGIAIIALLWSASLDYYTEFPCWSFLTGTECYNSQGTAIGFTPNSLGETMRADNTHEALICKQNLEIFTRTPAPSNASEFIVSVPVACFFERPDISSSTLGQCAYCLQSFPIVAEASDERGKWYLISTGDDTQGWINTEDGILNPPNAVIPTATP